MLTHTTLTTSATAALLTLALATTTTSWAAGSPGGQPGDGHPGAPGVGDPYYPLDGNGGYDVSHYDLRIRYDPSTDVLGGHATIRARATENLSSFDLDLIGLTVRAVTVDGRRARWSRDGQELSVVPRRELDKRERFTVRVKYDGVPQPIENAALGASGFFATDDGFDIAGQPQGAATWFPANDHPTDKASYTFRVKVPNGPKVVANGRLVDRRSRQGWTTWTWQAKNPMASYLATVDVGEFDITAYRRDGIRYLDAIDPDLFDPPAKPSTGTRFAVSQLAESSYKRLAHSISVPAGGASVAFDMTRNTEFDWGLRLRGGPHGRPGRLDHAARHPRSHQPGHRQVVSGVAGPPSLHQQPLPDRRPGGRYLHGDRGDRRMVGGDRQG
jgi:hypothetical protein